MQKNKEETYIAFHGSLDSPKSIGTNNLIKEGAKLVTQPEDIISNYNFLNKICEVDTEIVQENDIEEVPEEYKEIYNIISKDAIDINDIAKRTNLNLSEIISKLTMLELEGKVKKLPGNKYKRM